MSISGVSLDLFVVGLLFSASRISCLRSSVASLVQVLCQLHAPHQGYRRAVPAPAGACSAAVSIFLSSISMGAPQFLSGGTCGSGEQSVTTSTPSETAISARTKPRLPFSCSAEKAPQKTFCRSSQRKGERSCSLSDPPRTGIRFGLSVQVRLFYVPPPVFQNLLDRFCYSAAKEQGST